MKFAAGIIDVVAEIELFEPRMAKYAVMKVLLSGGMLARQPFLRDIYKKLL